MALRVFAFEDIDERLPLLPLAARRALDLAGRRLSLAAWRALPLRARQQLVEAGGVEQVPIAQVCAVADAASPAPDLQPTRDAGDWSALPEQVAERGVRPEMWRQLDELRRFALCHLAAKPGRHRYLDAALREMGLIAAESREVLVSAAQPHPSGQSRDDRAGQVRSERDVQGPAGVEAEAGAHRQLTHLNASGEARMVDVAAKPITARRAVAAARLRMAPATARLIIDGAGPKGDVLAVARVAGIQAAKRTPELIPLCHGIALSCVTVTFRVEADAGLVHVEAAAEALDRTGVEMEAIVAASVAALTVYDMLKAVQKDIVVERVVLLEKQGGRSGHYRYQGAE